MTNLSNDSESSVKLTICYRKVIVIIKNLDLMRPHYSELCQSTGSLLSRFVFTVISKHLDRLYISWSYEHWSVFYFLYVGRLSSLESSKDDFEEPLDDTSGRQSQRVECKRTSRCQKSRTSTRLRNEFSQTKECKNSKTVATFLISTV